MLGTASSAWRIPRRGWDSLYRTRRRITPMPLTLTTRGISVSLRLSPSHRSLPGEFAAQPVSQESSRGIPRERSRKRREFRGETETRSRVKIRRDPNGRRSIPLYTGRGVGSLRCRWLWRRDEVLWGDSSVINQATPSKKKKDSFVNNHTASSEKRSKLANYISVECIKNYD